MLGRTMRSLAACTAVLGTAGLAFATDRNVPGQYSTIQAAVDACASGDAVVCAAGDYSEAVVATKSSITIKGAAGAVWDGKTGTSAVTCLDVTGDAVVVTGFAFKNGVDHVVLTGKDCVVKACSSADAGGSFCKIKGERPKVDNCRVDRPRGPAVKCEGNTGVLTYVKVYDCSDLAVEVIGDACSVKNCWAERCDKGGYRCKGRDHYVRDCEARSCAEWGFKLEVEASTCLYNYAKECGTSGRSEGGGYLCVGSDNYFEYCDTLRCKPHGHHCKGDRNTHYDNWCDESEHDGFRHEGDDNDCEYNQARYCGRDGHRAEGNRNSYRSCDSYYNDDDGFDCGSGSDNSYRYCRGKSNGGAGCENGGSSTDVYGCTFLYNTVDVGLSGATGASFGTFSFNTFITGSITGILKIGLGL